MYIMTDKVMTMSETHRVKMEVLITMEEMDSTPEASAEIATTILEEILADQATHWNAKVTVMECWNADEEEVSQKAVEIVWLP